MQMNDLLNNDNFELNEENDGSYNKNSSRNKNQEGASVNKKKIRRSRIIISETKENPLEMRREIYDPETKYIKSLISAKSYNDMLIETRVTISKHFLKRKVKAAFEREPIDKNKSFFNIPFFPNANMFTVPVASTHPTINIPPQQQSQTQGRNNVAGNLQSNPLNRPGMSNMFSQNLQSNGNNINNYNLSNNPRMNQIATHNRLLDTTNSQKTISQNNLISNFNQQNSQKNPTIQINNLSGDVNSLSKNSIINQTDNLLKNPSFNSNSNNDIQNSINKPKIDSSFNKTTLPKLQNMIVNMNSITASKSDNLIKIPDGNLNPNHIANTPLIPSSSMTLIPSSKYNSSNKINFNIIGSNISNNHPISGFNSSISINQKKSEINDDFVSYDTESNDSSPRSNVGNTSTNQKTLNPSNFALKMIKNNNNENVQNNSLFNFSQQTISSITNKPNNFNSPNQEERINQTQIIDSSNNISSTNTKNKNKVSFNQSAESLNISSNFNQINQETNMSNLFANNSSIDNISEILSKSDSLREKLMKQILDIYHTNPKKLYNDLGPNDFAKIQTVLNAQNSQSTQNNQQTTITNQISPSMIQMSSSNKNNQQINSIGNKLNFSYSGQNEQNIFNQSSSNQGLTIQGISNNNSKKIKFDLKGHGLGASSASSGKPSIANQNINFMNFNTTNLGSSNKIMIGSTNPSDNMHKQLNYQILKTISNKNLTGSNPNNPGNNNINQNINLNVSGNNLLGNSNQNNQNQVFGVSSTNSGLNNQNMNILLNSKNKRFNENERNNVNSKNQETTIQIPINDNFSDNEDEN